MDTETAEQAPSARWDLHARLPGRRSDSVMYVGVSVVFALSPVMPPPKPFSEVEHAEMRDPASVTMLFM